METAEIEAIKEYIQTNIKISELLDTYEMTYKQVSPTRLKMCCPFHEESTGSFMVYLEKNSFHCFGCARNGNAITFLMYHQKKSFMEIMEMFKDKASAGEALVFEKVGRSLESSSMDLKRYIRSNKYSLGVFLRKLMVENESRWDEIDGLFLEMDNFFENQGNLEKSSVDEFVASIMGRATK
jgi:hypothetical protein